MNTGKKSAATGCISLVLLLLIVLMAGSAGCIKIAQNAISGSPAGDTNRIPVVTTAPTSLVQSTPTTVPIPVLTPAKSDIVTEVTPFETPNPYVFPQAVQINETPLQPSFQYRQPEFTKTYSLGGNAVGLLVNVVQGPLYIVYTVNPTYDCLQDPESCRGTALVTVNRPYMTITVRDNQTNDIMAEDGYGREFSSDTGNYQFVNSGYVDNSNVIATSVTEPGPRYIVIYKEGQFQITIDGDYLDVTVSVITGTSPNPLDATEKSQGSS